MRFIETIQDLPPPIIPPSAQICCPSLHRSTQGSATRAQTSIARIGAAHHLGHTLDAAWPPSPLFAFPARFRTEIHSGLFPGSFSRGTSLNITICAPGEPLVCSAVVVDMGEWCRASQTAARARRSDYSTAADSHVDPRTHLQLHDAVNSASASRSPFAAHPPIINNSIWPPARAYARPRSVCSVLNRKHAPSPIPARRPRVVPSGCTRLSPTRPRLRFSMCPTHTQPPHHAKCTVSPAVQCTASLPTPNPRRPL
ncbi:hypothetical protein HYPSUDRAFT_217653 [Hypholoma sublateritium FD-334 SS-4]|uniref:Uncharacterized protein n=1 Tax=Hypholoma sublateritium (strain FD-334 SS-4) TaxID=945553 RepID=A0A0D2KXY5_HYPSF|nr:hypothetical protein HYPSUDRAFT_217653 [Hypholoma sublateritium FD-334 SS-4]